jgi:hypothetical protein
MLRRCGRLKEKDAITYNDRPTRQPSHVRPTDRLTDRLHARPAKKPAAVGTTTTIDVRVPSYDDAAKTRFEGSFRRRRR